mgnify:CR=1 FL=1
MEIDNKINHLGDAMAFRERYFLNMIAVVGDAIISANSPKVSWKMNLTNDFTTWNPDLAVNNQQISFLTYLYEDLFISNKGIEHPLVEIYRTVNTIIVRE